jgi:hypothetical protein
MPNVVRFHAKLACPSCATASDVVFYTSGLGRDPIDTHVKVGDTLEVDRDDFADAYLTLREPEGREVRALERWGCAACKEGQWARLVFEQLDDEHYRFASATGVTLDRATLDGAHYISRMLDLWIDSYPARAAAILPLVAHLLPKAS